MTKTSTKDEALYVMLTEALPGFLISDFLRCQRLPSLPSIALRILRLTQSSKTTINDVAETIEHDPALTARLISLANSVHLTRSANSTQTCLEAIQRLGLDATLTVVLSFNLFQHPSKGPQHTYIWQRSILSALIARQLAEQVCPKLAGNAFTAALLQDIGILALSATYPEQADELYNDRTIPHDHLIQEEQRYFGCDHPVIGAWLAAKWRIPSTLVNTIRFSHAPYKSDRASDSTGDSAGNSTGDSTGDSTGNSLLDMCVRLSGPVADAYLSPTPEERLTTLIVDLSTTKGLPPVSIKNALQEVQPKMELIAQTLMMDAPASINPKELLEDAQQLLLNHTLILNSRREAQSKALTMLRKGYSAPDGLNKDIAFKKLNKQSRTKS
ncbi:HDOD domain-containing protein [Halomonas sp. SpR1]|uniref:HDOD domain-containing protein n=1 Tax=Halomonas sp. SpR1 TaxID=3050462 RepID=UPI0027E45FF0|nr:HDOD domain-containing protein [Halomonas sp. SpR1]MDQ7732739.1 HDOD domain-containing protein [Halomonas sp. SpR1]